MRLVSLKLRGGVSRNGNFSLKWRYYGPTGDILAGIQGKHRDQQRTTPQGTTGTWAHDKDRKGGRTNAGHDGRSRHAALGAETSGRGWRLAGVGNVQVDDVPHQDRRWGARVTKIEVMQQ